MARRQQELPTGRVPLPIYRPVGGRGQHCAVEPQHCLWVERNLLEGTCISHKSDLHVLINYVIERMGEGVQVSETGIEEQETCTARCVQCVLVKVHTVCIQSTMICWQSNWETFFKKSLKAE